MKNCKLKQGDCLELMKQLPSGCIDLTVTSPPYDNLRTYNGNIDQWCFEKFQKIAKELYRVTADGGVVVWIVADATIKGSETGTSFRQALWFKDCGFNLHDTMIWAKTGTAFPEFNRYYHTFEYMFVFSKGKPKAVNLIADRKNISGNRNINGTERQKDGTTIPMSTNRKNIERKVKEFGVRFNVWNMSGVKSNKERTGHPAQFPEAMVHDHIISWSNPGDVVLDPFMGSGTTGKVAIEMGRGFYGFELDPEYFSIASDRIDAAAKERVTFADTEKGMKRMQNNERCMDEKPKDEEGYMIIM